jgi:xylan 1,4-beta-xylosidase
MSFSKWDIFQGKTILHKGISTVKQNSVKAVINFNSTVKKLDHVWEKVICSGAAQVVTRGDLQQHLKMAHDDCGFKYVRFHGIFNDYLEACRADKNGALIYNWQNIDYIYGSLLSIGMKPFIEMSFMPPCLALGEKEHIPGRNCVTPPRDYGQWAQFIHAFAEHLAEHFGREEVREWYFELWNEPNLDGFWKGTQEEFFKLYAETAKAIKKADPEFRVGGPASARGEWVENFIKYCDTHDIPCDFISTHIYPDDEDFFTTDKDYVADFKGEDYVRKMVKMNYDITLKSRRTWPIYWTEYNSSWRFCMEDREGANQAAFICRMLHQVHDYVKSFAYWVVSDVYDEGGFPRTAFPGLFGLINFNGLPKASFNAYRLLHMLGDQEVHVEGDGLDGRLNIWAAKTESEGHVLAYYWQPQNHEELQEKKVNIALNGLGCETSNCQISTYLIDQNHSNVYQAWKKLGSPENLTEKDVKRLNAKSKLEMVEKKTVAVDTQGMVNLQLSIKPGSVVFFKIERDACK